MGEPGGKPTLDDAFEILANSHRRQILVALLEERPHAYPIDEGDIWSAGEHRERTHRLEVELYHNHLPKLESRGFVRWHRHTDEIEPGHTFEEIRPLVELLDNSASVLPGEWP